MSATYRGFAYGALDAGKRLGIIAVDADRHDWLDRIEIAADEHPDLARVFPTNDKAKARSAHEALARAAQHVELQQRLDLWGVS